MARLVRLLLCSPTYLERAPFLFGLGIGIVHEQNVTYKSQFVISVDMSIVIGTRAAVGYRARVILVPRLPKWN